MTYFSDRELGEKERSTEEISPTVWGGIAVLLRKAISSSHLAESFPFDCPDGEGNAGVDEHNLNLAISADIPDFEVPIRSQELPDQMSILDLIEFFYQHMSDVIEVKFHGYYSHHHFSFPESYEVREEFRININRIFSRNGVAFEITVNGTVERIVPSEFNTLLKSTSFDTGDVYIDQLMTEARKHFISPGPESLQASVEKLWDAFERLKTVHSDVDKRRSIVRLIGQAVTEENFREIIESESVLLTEIGNRFRIRHSETSQVELESKDHKEYLFYRLFSLVILLTKATNRTK